MSAGRVTHLLRIERIVASLERAVSFYRDALGFGIVSLNSAEARLRLGAQEIALLQAAPDALPYPADSISADLWFQHFAIVVADMNAAYARLNGFAHKAISTGRPQLLPASTGGVAAFKFRDPDGHPLELLAFPPAAGKAGPGIDHSAISVANVKRSIAFYTGLGLIVAARQVNRGPAQERLDALAGAVVEVVALSPAVAPTPHLELLAYDTPRGRPLMPPSRPGDIAADRLVFAVDDLAALRARLPGITLPDLRDPDGHLLRLEIRSVAP